MGSLLSEDAMTARILDATDAKIARGEDVALPTAVWAEIESGEHPVRAIRNSLFKRVNALSCRGERSVVPASSPDERSDIREQRMELS
jgi:hypothetical protein